VTPEPAPPDRFALLAAVGEVADGTPLLGEMVQRLLDVLAPQFADVATLDVAATTGEMRRLAARVENPREPELEQALLSRHQSGDSSVGVLRAMRTREGQLLAPQRDEWLQGIATGPEDLAMLRALGLRSTIYVPLLARDRVLGVLACSTRQGRRMFTAEDLRLAEALGNRIGLVLDNAGLSQTLRSLESRLEVTLAHLAAGVIVRDGSGEMVFANPRAAELLGLSNVEELFGTAPEELMALFDAYDENRRPLSVAELPSARALAGEQPPPLTVRSVPRRGGPERWLLHKATPVFTNDGELSLVVNVIEDITEAKRAEFSQRLLAEAGRELGSSLDYEQTLQRVARLAVPHLADWCGVSIRGAGATLQQVAVAHVNPDKVELARRFGERYPTRIDRPSGAAEVLRTGQPQFVPEITEEIMAAAQPAPEQLALLEELQMRSVIIVPLAVPGRPPFGTLTLVMAESGRRLVAEDLEVAAELGRRAGAAVENARLYTERTRLAHTLQHSLLPPVLPQIPGFRLASLYRPAGEDSEVGGDFYDAFQLPGGTMVVVGDVTGHGAEAAALTSLSRYTLRTAAQLLGDPVAAVEQLNRALRERPQLSLVSLCCAFLRQGEGDSVVELLLAGHPPPFHVRDGSPREVGLSSPLLGLDDHPVWRSCQLTLEPGDVLLLYTDGVVDTFREGERFGEERLAETLQRVDDAPGAVAEIDASLSEFSLGEQRDDTAVLALERVGQLAGTGAPVAVDAMLSPA
jgi:PAS domain S-box-containing protein